jgi:hypothetical protein
MKNRERRYSYISCRINKLKFSLLPIIFEIGDSHVLSNVVMNVYNIHTTHAWSPKGQQRYIWYSCAPPSFTKITQLWGILRTWQVVSPSPSNCNLSQIGALLSVILLLAYRYCFNGTRTWGGIKRRWTSQIFLRETPILPKRLSYEKYCTYIDVHIQDIQILVKFWCLGGISEMSMLPFWG